METLAEKGVVTTNTVTGTDFLDFEDFITPS